MNIITTIMADYSVYLEKLTLFGTLLRREGITAAPRETEDACRILLALNLEDRETVKTALRTVYAKSREDQIRFNRVFDSFFLSEDRILALDKKHREEELARAQAREQAKKDLQGETPNLPYSPEQQEAYSQLPAEEKERLQGIKEKYMGEGSRNPELYGNFIHSVFARSILEQQMRAEDAALGAQAVDPEMGMLFQELSQFREQDIPKAVSYIQNIARQINGELTRRQKRGGVSGKLNFRRTIRRGLETGGTFYRLSFRKKRAVRRQLIVLCDVSGSMIQFSEFVLRFIQALNQTADSSRIFLFSEELYEADRFQLQNMDRFREYVRSLGIYGRGTDLGSALKKLNESRPAVIGASTMLLIISDTKTVNRETAEKELLRARSGAGRVFILNPIPERKWKYTKSVQSAAAICPMIPCSTLEELGAACRKLAFM